MHIAYALIFASRAEKKERLAILSLTSSASSYEALKSKRADAYQGAEVWA